MVLLGYKFRKQAKVMVIALLVFLTTSAVVYIAIFGFYLQKHSPADLLTLHKKMINYHTRTVDEIVSQDKTLQRQERQNKALFWPLNGISSYRFEKNGDSVKGVVFFYSPLVI